MQPLARLCLLVSALACATPAVAASFSNDTNSMWVQTPQGKFECVSSDATDNMQVLRLNGRVIFRQQPGPDGIMEGDTLQNGIVEDDAGCPSVIAVHAGYVVISHDVAPPHYGATGYAVIDFNKQVPSLTELAVGQRPRDDKIPDSRRVEWSATSLTLRAIGFTSADQCCSADSPKPRPLRVRYTFATGQIDALPQHAARRQ